jgi:glycosyltransferase involved in cell wall biosynthesis
MEYKISIVMSVYNAEDYLKSAIDSVLAQTFPDFEFIVWNDGSTDNSEAIIKAYNDERIRYYYHENMGLGQALRLACEKAQCKYIARMDADDICLPDRLQKQYDYMESHPDCVLNSTPVIYINEKDEYLGQTFPFTDDRILRGGVLSIFHSASIFVKDAYMKTGGYPPTKDSQDDLLWSRMRYFGKFSNFNEPLIKYRLIETSISHSKDPDSPYYKMWKILRKKMIWDSVIREDDIAMYNKLSVSIPKVRSKYHYKVTLEEKFYRLLSRIIGNEKSRHLVIMMRNMYGLYKYRSQIKACCQLGILNRRYR